MNFDGLYILIQRLGIKNIQHEDISALISICKWISFNPNGDPFVTPPKDQPIETLTLTLEEFSDWMSCLGSYRYLQKKLQVFIFIMRFIIEL